MCTLSVTVAKALEARGVRPAYVAGFSLGQIAALAVSGMVSERDAFRIAAFRAKVMAEAAAARPGSMCALLGGEPEEASEVCSSALRKATCSCAPTTTHLVRLLFLVTLPLWIALLLCGKNARAIRLRCSRPRAHSTARLCSRRRRGARGIPRRSRIPRGSHAARVQRGRPSAFCGRCRAHLASQVVSPVLFEQSVHWLSEQGVDAFVECGFGGVLTKLVKRIEPAAARFAPVSSEEIAQVASESLAAVPNKKASS